MFDIGASELLLTVIVAIVVIGPKDLPRALRRAGGWLGKIRRVSGHFRSGIEEMIRQAELEDMEKKWLEKNAAIMQQEVAAEATGTGVGHDPHALPAAGEGASPHSHSPHSHSFDSYDEVHAPALPVPDEQPEEPARESGTDKHSPELPLASPKAQA
jgi:sec-independent protein translocase protein TatB